MGDTIPDKVLQFAVADKNDNYLPNQQIQLYLMEGDGHLNPKSVTTDSTGIASFPYGFTGDSGHAVIRLVVEGIDSLDIFLRANTLIPGPGGQAQCVLFDDTYADVKNFNGLPASVDVDPDYWVVYANYESALGVVVVIDDANKDESAADWEEVKGVIVNTVYSKKTAQGIGIGSPIDSVRGVYGEPNRIWFYDLGPPEEWAVVFDYDSFGLSFFCDTVGTNVEEIHLTEWIPITVSGGDSATNRALSNARIKPRRFRAPK